MNYSLTWKPEEAEFFFCMLMIAFGFMGYYFISKSEKQKKIFQNYFGEEKNKITWVLFERLLGVFFFGILPLTLIFILGNNCLCQYGLSTNHGSLSIYWILGLSPVLIIMNYINCSKPDNLAMYPQIRKAEWNILLLILSAFSWSAYLLAYEFMFRGYLLFVSLRYLGTWPAIALNVAIYALVHVPKGYKEAIGAVPLGIVLGMATVETGNILAAFIVHVVLALSNEWLSIRANPEMKFVNK
jgi:membrane protease YdiL (CAAX protease family)